MGRNKNNKHIPQKPSETQEIWPQSLIANERVPELKKDPGIPRLPDLKQKKNVERQRTVSRASQPLSRDQDSPMASEPTLSSLAAMAEATASEYSALDTSSDPSSSSSSDAYKMQLRRQYIRTLHKVIEESDIIILVLDARDPEGCRSRLVEEEVRRREHEGKKLVFVLNKIDLVPRENAEAWLRYLRHTTPTLPFRSSTQQQRTNLVSKTSPALLNLLKALKRSSHNSKSGSIGSVTVGVVGYPNVGKSSLINSLRRAKVCGVAAEAGFTKEMQSVQVERGVRVLDSPGVVFDDDEQEANNLLLRNVVKVEDMADPIAVVDQILTRTSPSTLERIYFLPNFSSTLEFLTMLALSSGRLHKGGTPDILAAARTVIQDWNSQKIPYHTTPPSIAAHPSNVPDRVSTRDAAKYGLMEVGTRPSKEVVVPGAEDVGEARIVNEMAPAFDLGGLFSQADVGAFEPETTEVEMDLAGEDITNLDAMDSEALDTRNPRKHPRSPSPSSFIDIPHPSANQSPPPSKRSRHSLLSSNSPPSSRINPVTEFDPVDLADKNPLNRRVLQRDAKKAKKAARRAGRKKGEGMEVDPEEGSLAFTFMAGMDGVVA